LFFRGQLHFAKARGDVSADEVKEDFNLLRRFNAALAVALMHKDFFNKLIEHSVCQRVKILVFLYKGDKLIG